jgi:nitroreductase
MSTPTRTAEPGTAPSTDFLEVLYRRRAVRAYEPDVVDEHTIRSLLDAAVHAPTAMHQEPCRFVVVQDRALLRELSDAAKEMARRQAAEHGNLLRTPGAPGDGTASPLADPEFNIFYDANTLIVICAKATNEFVIADCWLAAENLMLAACADGLGTCCIGFAVPVLNSPHTKQLLGIPDDVRAVAPIIVGNPRMEPTPVPRKMPVVLNWLR